MILRRSAFLVRPIRVASVAMVLSACSAEIETVGGWSSLEELGVLGFLPGEDGGGVAYLCGTGDQVEQSQWLSTDDGLSFSSEDGAWTLERAGEGFVLGSPQASWEGTLIPFTEDGGLYDASPEACRSGAVLHSGSLSGTWCSGTGIFRQVEPVDTFTGAPASIAVRLLEDASYTFTIQRLR